MAKLLKTTTSTSNATNTNSSHRPSGSSSGKKVRASISGGISTAGVVVSPAGRQASLSCGGGGGDGARKVAVLVPCREEEWSQLSSYIMHKFTCQQLNQQMESAYSVVEARCVGDSLIGLSFFLLETV